eukprot:gnl/TRDRNA2_/TRDRNA2_157183_c1_seq1.p2 gnl/TRDRNA2_/TRDRNA2_157183_c1~~gnl/TRDRNA2_/TRDRNA2_157183_c1_seq1.p2  ORF type:complete len:101 (+),score=23.41 gnl/TRDRNA2_/TRDRNA2_157183_c1_seq1:149-451(+)
MSPYVHSFGAAATESSTLRQSLVAIPALSLRCALLLSLAAQVDGDVQAHAAHHAAAPAGKLQVVDAAHAPTQTAEAEAADADAAGAAAHDAHAAAAAWAA